MSREDRLGIAASLGLVAAIAALWAAFGPALSANGGLGYDGLEYVRAILALRGQPELLDPPYAYRIAPTALVAISGMDPRAGLLALNLAATLASAVLVYALLRRHSVDPKIAVLGVLWWAVLPFNVRYVLYYPTLLDGTAQLLLLLLLHTALSRRAGLFAVVLAVAVATRENLLGLVPFLWLRMAAARAGVRTAVLAPVPALLVLIAVHLAPPVPVATSSPSTFDYIGAYGYATVTNADGHLWRLIAAFPLTLGVLLALPFADLRGARSFFASEPGWAYYVAMVVVTATVGGLDRDRYLLALSPLALVLTFRNGRLWRSAWSAAILTALHLIATRSFWPPLDGTESSYFAWMVHSMDLMRLAALSALVVCCGLLALAVSLIPGSRLHRRIASGVTPARRSRP